MKTIKTDNATRSILALLENLNYKALIDYLIEDEMLEIYFVNSVHPQTRDEYIDIELLPQLLAIASELPKVLLKKNISSIDFDFIEKSLDADWKLIKKVFVDAMDWDYFNQTYYEYVEEMQRKSYFLYSMERG